MLRMMRVPSQLGSRLEGAREKGLIQKFGSCARAWRRGIDPQGHFYIDKLILRHFCRSQDLDKTVNLQSLWTTLDSDKDGRIGLQDVAPLGAVALASFRAWCRRMCGSCRAVWNLPSLARFPVPCTLQPAWNEIRNILLERYGSRLSTIGTTAPTWPPLGAPRNTAERLAAAGHGWTERGFIDNDASGYISMEEFSPEHYNVLMSFKEWASGLYGSVGNAFKNFDKEGDGALTLSILRRACQKGKWSGDPQKLFDSVGPSSAKDIKLKQITVEDVSFLDLWPDREDQGEDQGEVEVEIADADLESSPEHHSAKILPLAPTVFQRLYQVPSSKRCRSAPSLTAFTLDPMTKSQQDNGSVCQQDANGTKLNRFHMFPLFHPQH
eukprot:Skav206827  [mRNA]  locus=scaffold3672:85453:93187:+ [translate_table: standard]